MDNIEFKEIWNSQQKDIEKALEINQYVLNEVVNQKVKASMRKLISLKSAGIAGFILYVLFLVYILMYAISDYSSAWNYFIISISAITIINVKGLYDYIKHLIWAKRLNYNGSIFEIQEHLFRLQLSIIQHAKTMTLQFPFYTTFYLTNLWFPQEIGLGYMCFQIGITGAFTYLSYWLYVNQKVENLDKKWFRNLIAGSGGRSVMEAIDFYKEVERFKRE